MSNSTIDALLNPEKGLLDQDDLSRQNSGTALEELTTPETVLTTNTGYSDWDISTVTEVSAQEDNNSVVESLSSWSNVPVADSAGVITFGTDDAIAPWTNRATWNTSYSTESEEEHSDHFDAYPVSDNSAVENTDTSEQSTGSSEGIITNNTTPRNPISFSNFDLNQFFRLNSNPNANHTIYLDFNGHTTQNTFWNDASNPTIISPAYDTDGNTASFSTSELQDILGIWQRVSEDFAPFNVNVTTEAPNIEDLRKSGTSDTRWGIRTLMTQNINLANNTAVYANAGGVAYLDSFNYDSDTPAFAFNKGENNAAMTASHEIGHSLNLNHDGTSTTGYFSGYGSGETSWGPLMGAPFGQSLTQWSKGEYAGANNLEDDLAVITTNNGFNYRADDYGNSFSSATRLYADGNNTISTFGIIERNTDQDVFSFTTGTGNISLTISAASRNYLSDGSGNFNVQYLAGRGSNLDLWAGIYNSSGTLVAQANPTDLLSVSFTNLSLNSGLYYLQIDGVGKIGTDAYSDYGSLGQYSINGSLTRFATTRNDFNNDQKSDILWRNNSGDVYLWQMDGTSVPAFGDVARGVTADWRLSEVADFTADGKSDILWRNNNGNLVIWQMDGRTIASSSYIANVTSDWKISDTADFTGDGKSDILWRNDNGGVAIWQMDGFSLTGSAYLGVITADWKIADTADFTGDGKADILWRNDNGNLVIWQMDGSSVASSGSLGSVTSDWKISDTADFTGDGKADILWRNDNGSLVIWQMDGFSIAASGSLGSVTSDWQVGNVGYYNGDGKADIFWRNANGSNCLWFMDGATITSSGFTSSADTSWSVV